MSPRSSLPLLALLIAAFSLFAATPMQAQTFPAPSNVQVVAGDASVTVSWDAVTNANQYLLRIRQQGVTNHADVIVGPETSATIPDGITVTLIPTGFPIGGQNPSAAPIRNGVTYEFRVAALPDDGILANVGAWSQWQSATPIATNFLSLSYAKGRFREGSSTTFWVELVRPRSSNLTIPLIASAIKAEAGDYSAPSSITIPAGVTKVWGTVTANQDGDNDDETFNLGIDRANMPTTDDVFVGVLYQAWFTIIDDDVLPTVTLSATPNPVNEGSDVTITAELSEALESSVGIPLTVRQGTSEFFDVGMVDNITIAAGQTTGTTTVATEQDVDADDETFSVYVPQYHLDQMNLYSNVWITAGAGSSVQITIRDDDGAGQQLVPRRSVVTEGTTTVMLSATHAVVEGSPFTITVTLSKALSSAVTIPFKEREISNRSVEDGDYEHPSDITIPAGQTTATVTLRTNQDSDTDDEFIDVSLGSGPQLSLPRGIVPGSVTSVRIYILDDDKTQTTVAIEISPNQVEEGSSTTVTVHVGKTMAQPLTLPLSFVTADYTVEPGDFTPLESITIPAGQTTAIGTLRTNQDDDKDDESFLVQFGTLPASVVANELRFEQIVHILDDDNAELTLSAEKTSVTEGESVLITMTFTEPVPLQRNQSALIPIRVTGIDTEPGDIRSPSSFGIRVDGGMTSQTFFLGTGIDGDSDDETFRVALDADHLPSWVWAGDPESVVITIEEYQPETQTPLELSSPLVEGLSSANLSALAETSQSRGTFVIFSTRAVAGTEEERMIGVFVIEDDPKTVLVQAQGPELANPPLSLSNVLADPVLTVIRQSDGKELVVNDDWEDNQKQDVTDVWAGSPNLDAGSKSSAAILTIQPGSYSAIVEGKNGATGIVRVEVYDLD